MKLLPPARPVFKWLLHRVDIREDDPDQQIIHRLHWYISAVRNPFVADRFGIVELEEPDSESLLLPHEVTEDVALGWVFESLGEDFIAGMKQELEAQLIKMEEEAEAETEAIPELAV